MTTSSTPSPADRAVKRERMLALLDEHGADRLWLSTPPSLAWYLDGARVHTSLLGGPIAAVEVGRDADRVAIFANELDRLVAEELPADIETVPVEWHAPLDSARTVGGLTLSEGVAEVDAALRAARATLLPAETARFRDLGRDTAEALTRMLASSRADQTERELSAELGAEILALGADPAVIMVAGADRLGHRHPLPTTALLGDRTMVVVCARRHGLVANITRWVRRTEPTALDLEQDAAIRAVEADFFAATRVGRTLAEVLADGAASYARHGFAEDEWTRHHQGGAAGYAGRDPRAAPTTLDRVHPYQAFAWNPTAPGRKIEDTVIISTSGIEVLTHDPAWPTTPVATVPRPLDLLL